MDLPRFIYYNMQKLGAGCVCVKIPHPPVGQKKWGHNFNFQHFQRSVAEVYGGKN
jgi:hypothetical protein